MANGPRLQGALFKTEGGREPVRQGLLALPCAERQVIGTDLLDVQYGWPVGMPLVRKLDAAGADCSRIVILSAVRGQGKEWFPTLLDLAAIRVAIEAVNAKLVIIDPLMAYLPGKVDSHRDQYIRSALAPLAALAAEMRVALLIVRHLNKSGGGNPLYRGGGSIGIIGAARSGLLVAKDPEDEDRRIPAVTKSNLAKIPSALAYRVVANTSEVPSILWEGATEHTATSLLATQADGEDRNALDEAKEFLRELLKRGAMPAKEIQTQSNQVGISYATLRRAKTALKIAVSKRNGFFSKGKESQQWCWMLPAAEGAHAFEFEYLQRVNEHLQGDFDDDAREAYQEDL